MNYAEAMEADLAKRNKKRMAKKHNKSKPSNFSVLQSIEFKKETPQQYIDRLWDERRFLLKISRKKKTAEKTMEVMKKISFIEETVVESVEKFPKLIHPGIK